MVRCTNCMEVYDETLGGCPHCGYQGEVMPEEAVCLPGGSYLHQRYMVGRMLGHGSFGIIYLCFDEVLQQKVAIKEYFPGDCLTRKPGSTEVLLSDQEMETALRDGVRKFIEEARNLAKFQNEDGIVKVFDTFEENGTAYIVMEYLEGKTLEEVLQEGKFYSGDEAVALLMPLMHSLEAVHERGMLHRDISPDNIMITSDGQAKLLDFGSARYATGSKSLTVIVKPGYSPEEQYRSTNDQGPYTDVYALAATLYRMITGTVVPDAMERRTMLEQKGKDPLKEPHKLQKDLSEVHETALMNALNVQIQDRTPDVKTFIQELTSEKPAVRKGNKIRRSPFYSWPLWAKIFIPTAAALLLLFVILTALGVLSNKRNNDEIHIPDMMASVPDVEGLEKDIAVQKIEETQLNAFSAGNVTTDYVPEGRIVLQDPTAGSYLKLRGNVFLTVSRGKSDVKPGSIPYLFWCTEQEATALVSNTGLKVTVQERYDDHVTEGRVISQSIDPGKDAGQAESMELVVSKGPEPFSLPDLKGKKAPEAIQELIRDGLSVSYEYTYDDNRDENEVTSQIPEAGEEVKKGDEITISIVTKERLYELRDVRGLERSEAEKILKDENLVPVFYEFYDAEVPKDTVADQYPVPGTMLKEGAEVAVTISLGVKKENGIPVVSDDSDSEKDSTGDDTAVEENSSDEGREEMTSGENDEGSSDEGSSDESTDDETSLEESSDATDENNTDEENSGETSDDVMIIDRYVVEPELRAKRARYYTAEGLFYSAEFEYDDYGRLVAESREYTDNTFGTPKSYMVFDEYGNRVIYDEWHGDIGERTERVPEYDEEGKLIREDLAFYDIHNCVDRKPETITPGYMEGISFEYTYYDSGALKSMVQLSDFGRDYWTEYDERGNVTASYTIDHGEDVFEPWSGTEFTYNEKDEKVSSRTFAGAGRDATVSTSSFSYTYDSEGRILTETESGSGRSNTTTYTYDNEGHILSIDFTAPQMGTFEVIRYEYEYEPVS